MYLSNTTGQGLVLYQSLLTRLDTKKLFFYASTKKGKTMAHLLKSCLTILETSRPLTDTNSKLDYFVMNQNISAFPRATAFNSWWKRKSSDTGPGFLETNIMDVLYCHGRLLKAKYLIISQTRYSYWILGFEKVKEQSSSCIQYYFFEVEDVFCPWLCLFKLLFPQAAESHR